MFNPCIEEGQAFTECESSMGHDSARVRNCSPGQVDGDSGYNSGEDSDCSGKGALLDNETPTSAAIQARLLATPVLFAPYSSRSNLVRRPRS